MKRGDILGSRWTVHSVMRGGLGAVLIVYDRDTREVQAAKTFLSEGNEIDVERFRQESYAWIKLGRHPNVVEARSFEVIQGRPYLFLEYVPGGDLEDRLYGTRLTPRQAIEWGLQFCDGMNHSYSRGLKAHRDIKPANCLLTEDGRLKITDFGLASLNDDDSLRALRKKGRWSLWLSSKMSGKMPTGALTEKGDVFGTCTHMAPEQFQDSSAVDHRADVYSFGVMLFEMLVGDLPFQANSFYGLAYKHLQEKAPGLPSCDLPSTAQRLLKDLVAGCLAKDPQARPQDFSSVRGQLEEIFREAYSEEAPSAAGGTEADALDFNDQAAGLCNLGLYEEAWAKLDRALELSPEMVAPRVNKAVILTDRGDPQGALKLLEEAARLEPHTATFNQLGRVLWKLGRADEAEKAFLRSLEIDPQSYLTYHNLGLHLAASGRHQEAQQAFDKALEVFPRFERAWLGKAMSLFNMPDLVGCLRCMKKAVELNPNFVDGWSKLADVYITLNKLEDAEAAAARALALGPDSGDAWLQSARVDVCRQRYEVAVEKLNKALVLDSELELGWYVLGSCLSLLERYQQAVESFDRCLALNPGDVMGHYNRGVALWKMGRSQEARLGLQRAAELGSQEAKELLKRL